LRTAAIKNYNPSNIMLIPISVANYFVEQIINILSAVIAEDSIVKFQASFTEVMGAIAGAKAKTFAWKTAGDFIKNNVLGL